MRQRKDTTTTVTGVTAPEPVRRWTTPGGEQQRHQRHGEEPRTCTSFGLPVSKSTLSHHFKVLREAGLVRQVDLGNMSGVTLRHQDIDARFPGLLGLIGDEG